jgi:hypothetical protein
MPHDDVQNFNVHDGIYDLWQLGFDSEHGRVTSAI